MTGLTAHLRSQISNAFRTNPAWRERLILCGGVALVGLVAWPAPLRDGVAGMNGRSRSPVASSQEPGNRAASIPPYRLLATGYGVSLPAPSPGPATPPRADRRLLTVTAYCPCARCCGSWARRPAAKRKMADGSALYPLRPAVAAPDGILFGTLLRIPGYCQGRAVEVRDRGGAIDGKRSDLDVLFPTHRQALAWGRRVVVVEIENKK